MNLRYTRTALREIDQIFSYVVQHDPSAAGRIVARVAQLVSRLGEFPYLGQVVDEGDVRVVPLGRHPYLVFYRVGAEEIAILHVRHAARLRR